MSDDVVSKLTDAWDRFVAEISDVIRKVRPEEETAETVAADAEKAAKAAEESLVDVAAPVSNIPPEPAAEESSPADSSVPEDPTDGTASSADPSASSTATPETAASTESAPIIEEPKSNIDPAEDQPLAVGKPDVVATTTETFGPGDTPAESVSLGTTETTMPVVEDPAAVAAAAQAEANAHPTVTGEASALSGAPMSDETAQWLAANGLTVGPTPV